MDGEAVLIGHPEQTDKMTGSRSNTSARGNGERSTSIANSAARHVRLLR